VGGHLPLRPPTKMLGGRVPRFPLIIAGPASFHSIYRIENLYFTRMNISGSKTDRNNKVTNLTNLTINIVITCFIKTGLLCCYRLSFNKCKKGKGCRYAITERRIPELIPVLGSQPVGDMSHKPDGRLPLLSARPAVTPATLKRAATNFAAWRTEAQ